LKKESKSFRETYRSSWETLSTVEREIVSLRHALLDLHLTEPDFLRSRKNKTIYPDLVDVITNVRTILELKLNPTLSFNQWEPISHDSWVLCLKNVLWAVGHEKVTEQQRKEIDELREWINTKRDNDVFKRAQPFFSKLNQNITSHLE